MKSKILSVILVMVLFITSYMPASVVRASEIDNRAGVDSAVKIKSFYSNGKTSVAISEEGDLYCWGYNEYGQVGNKTIDNQLTPVKVLENVKEFSMSKRVGYTFGAITSNGDLYCWGYNKYGQVGDGTTTNQLTPVKVLENVKDFSISSNYTSGAIWSYVKI